MPTSRIRELYEDLGDLTRRDPLRATIPFSADLERVHEVLFDDCSGPAADELRQEALEEWLSNSSKTRQAQFKVKGYQPCVFGRTAAREKRVFFCLFGEEDLMKTDDEIREKFQLMRKRWKKRAAGYPGQDAQDLPHGFVLLAYAPRIANAEPAAALHQFTLELRRLWDSTIEKDARGNDRAWETLYLRSPTAQWWKFTFTIDFFASQGDGRWWEDHRFPGGVAFTANSLGHMARWRQWWSRESETEFGEQLGWAAENAIVTISGAAHTKYSEGPTSSWLLKAEGRLRKPAASPPYEGWTPPKGHADVDWTMYRSHAHSDQSIRREYFHPEAELPKQSQGKEANAWLAEFDYIYDPKNKDHEKFMGIQVTEKEVDEAIGLSADPEDSLFPNRTRPRIIAVDPASNRLRQKVERLREWFRSETSSEDSEGMDSG